MATDEEKAIERLKIRADLRSAGEDELSDVIQREAAVRSEKPKVDSHPAPARFFLRVLEAKPSAGAVIVALAIIAVVAYAVGKGLKIFP